MGKAIKENIEVIHSEPDRGHPSPISISLLTRKDVLTIAFNHYTT